MLVGDLLTSELQLGQQLNQSVAGDQRADFSLLLAMLSSDICDQSQFHINEPQKSNTDSPETDLWKKFELPAAQKLVATSDDGQYSLDVGKLASDQGIVAARLAHCLNPEPMCYQLDRKHNIDSIVFDNLDYVTAAKFTGQVTKIIPEKIDLDQLIANQQAYQAQLNITL